MESPNSDPEKPSPVSLTEEPEASLTWDDPRETRNPIHWSTSRRVFHTVIPCCAAFEATFATSIMVPATPMLMQEFGIPRTQALLSLTLYTMGIAIGPLLIAPLSEVFGRKYVYVASLTMLLAFTGGAGAAQSFGTLLACRLLAGILGSSTVAIGAGTIADVWALGKSGGTASLFFILGPFLGPTLGPLAGAYILHDRNDDWRWTMWLLMIVGAPIWIGSIIMSETSHTILTQRYGYVQELASGKGLFAAAAEKVLIGIKRPTKMLCTEPIVISLSLYTAFAYATVFSYFGSASYVLQRYYHFNTREVGLSFISVIIGYLLAALMFGTFDKTLFAKAVAAGNGTAAPEHRLYAGMVGSIFLPISLFWYAWEVKMNGNWAALVAAGIPFGLGSFSIFLSSITYMVDVYKARAAASAIAANGVLRYLLGAVFPLFTIQMYQSLGPHWASSIFAFVAVLLMPIPWLLFKFGHKLR
ncbi:putative MFS polyamine transporter [Aureobasidium pullulans]|uniref:Putative MFS polyamine transporter n=1 Tax=Aureobasidium pullulans TaxID=5580 RepID=A0A4S9GPZ1_AURPU|nr:putative MFS polyamine transporter [Aureobasidium pullulans]THX41378.1 putative MFS polyamine transporter [Aureobasidium pullulans]THX62989.1 putative MFS polyamine transporter [Aureobasidium pullulans]THY40928.1 putative MFS polyamine transporter [Aureobasidium pullulans]THZ38779.1 putative MFS polyamine transporter [Aureobasidium pullulans]